METVHAASSVRRTTGAHLSHAMQPQAPSAQERRIRRLIGALQSLDDHTLSQIGIERREIERFAHAAVAHNL